MRKNKGFTLLELMVVILLIMVLTGIAAPNYLVFMAGNALKSAARDLYSNMQLAKITAIKENKNCSITFTSAGYTVTSGLGTLNKTVLLSDYGYGVIFQRPTWDQTGQAFPGTITFNPRGTSNSQYTFFTNGKQKTYYRVGPLISGIIKIDRGEGAWP